MAKSKIKYIEWLRIASAMAVIGIHITMTQPNNYSIREIGVENYLVLTSVYALVMWAVPVFLMITGNLLLHSNSLSLDKVKKMCIRIAVVLAIFGAFFAFLGQVFEARSVSLSMIPKSFLLVLEQKSWSHLWYLYVLIGIYIVIVPLKRFVDSLDKKEIVNFTALLIIGNIAIPTINMMFNTKIYTFMVFTQWVTYILLGYVLGDFFKDSSYYTRLRSVVSPGKVGGVLIIVFVLAALAKIAIQFMSVKCNSVGATLFLEDRLFTMIQACTVFSVAIIFFDKRELGTIFQSISDCSFGIYLVHPLFINILYKALKITPTSFPGGVWLGIFSLWIIVFILSFLSALILKRLPFIKNLV